MIVVHRHLGDGIEMRGDFTLGRIEGGPGAMRLHATQGGVFECDALVLCVGAQMGGLLQLCDEFAPFQTTSGQVSWLKATPATMRLGPGVSFGGYLTPAYDGLHDLGATFTLMRKAWSRDISTISDCCRPPPEPVLKVAAARW